MSAPESPGACSLDAWLRALEGAHDREIDLGLERVRMVWAALGAPRPGARVVTVAGTNGKGSTVLALEALLRSCGLRTGATLSPHLVRFNERIRVDGREAGDEAIVDAFERIEAARCALVDGPVTLTYFETAIMAARLLLADAGCDVAILEVGLGGRLDAVNIVDADVAVITPVDLDHQAWLGDDRESIGAEKAGILRAGRPAVLTDRAPPASVLARCAALDAPVLRIGRDFDLDDRGDFRCGPVPGAPSAIDLEDVAGGSVHPDAAAGALAVLRILGITPTAPSVREVLSALQIPGRLQQETFGSAELLLDVAHNPHAARALAERLDATRPHALLFGAYGDKVVTGVLAPIRDRLGDRLRAVTFVGTTGARGLCATELEGRVSALGLPSVRTAGSPAAGLSEALGRLEKGALLLVCGSFTVVGAVLEELEAGRAS
jgi:dihydrofolate synthase/folylpolyglutamate synthase